MKKILGSVFAILLLFCCGLFYGCGGDKYSGLSFSAGISYDRNGSNVEVLSNGDYRVKTSEGVFDDHLDGSYTFYITENSTATATLQATYKGVSEDFNKGVSVSISNEIVSVPTTTTYSGDSVKKSITAYEKGTTLLTVYSNETGKTSKITVNVVKVATSMGFKNDNLAMASILGNKLTLTDDLIQTYPERSDITNISYQIGKLDANYNFIEYSQEEIVAEGISYDKNTSTLTVLNQNFDDDFDGFYVKATYDNPLAKDGEVNTELTDITKVKIVKPITNFNLYYGSSSSEVTEENKLKDNDIKNLIINIEDLNYTDLIVVVNSNKEKVSFGYVKDSALPVSFKNNKNSYEYFNAAGPVDDWSEATKTYYYVKIIASKKTTDNDAYKSGVYDLNFTCDYSDYVVEGYPIKKVLKIKNDTLVKNFSVNGEILESESIIETPTMTGFYDEEVYINNDPQTLGASLRISVGNPVVILNQNARFTLTLYKRGEVVTNVSEHFKVQKSVGNSRDIVNVTDNFATDFEKDTTFYIKPNNDAGKVQLGDTYYLIVRAVLPEEEAYAEKQALATIKLRVVQGISSFEGFDFIYNQYKVGDDGLYEVDEETNEKIVVTTSQQNIKFDDSLISEQTLNLDLESGFPADITLRYLPAEADLNNIIITSSNEKVIRVVRNINSDKLNQFKIYPVNIGSDDYIEISTTNLDVVYKIKVNVYRPITNFTVNLSSTNSSSGVGGFELDTEGKNIKAAEVQVNKTISLTFATLPATASKYSLEYYVYVSSVEEENLLGNYSINYKGETSSSIAMVGNEHFQLDCKRNSFVFIKDESVGTTYYVVIKLTNLDGSYWSRTIELTSYVPVESIDTDLTRTSLYNPNFIAFSHKNQNASDPTAFALKIEPNKNSGRVPTYNFENYGRIVVKVNGITENTFSIQSGNLVANNENSIILLVRSTLDDNGYYWFKLNPNYDYAKIISAVYLSIEIKEINSYFSKPISLRIFNAEQVSSLMTEAEEQQYFKQGLSEDKTIKINVIKETAYNKNLLVKVYDVFNIDGKEYYFENIEANSTVKDVNITQGKNSTEYLLNISPFNAGKSVVIVMPEDRVVYLEQYSSWYSKQYIPIDILPNEFIADTFYYQESTEYVVATEFAEGVQYFILATKIDENISIWNGYLTFYVTVADGIKIPYQIATEKELKEIDDSVESLSKRYILTKDIILTSSNWQPLANQYYLVGSIEEETFKNGVYYILNEGNYILQETYTADAEYYTYGFNGELSGKYSYINVKGIQIDYFYKIANFTFVGRMQENTNNFGLFSQTGKQARVFDLKLDYAFFQPVLTSSFSFGALSGTHYGYAKNIEVSFNNFTLSSSNNLTIGGVVGNNKGIIENNNTSSTGISGVLNIGLANESLTANIGGIAGVNENTIIGSYDVEKDIVYTFNNAGFDSSLNIIVENKTIMPDKNFENTFIGGAVGRNTGLIKGVSIQGNITATHCHNVGGLVGFAGFHEDFNGVKTNDDGSTTTLYSIRNSYSIARVKGYEYVGGAIGQINGTSEIYIYNVSAENYVQSGNNRIFVQGYEYVGGFVGAVINANISYSYSVSYYDCSKFTKEQQFADNNNYDVVSIVSFQGGSGTKIGGFAGVTTNTYISNSSSYLNIKGTTKTGVFIGEANSTDGKNIFAIANLYASSQDLVVGNIGFEANGTDSYSYAITYSNWGDLCYSQKNSADIATIMGATLPDGWAKDTNGNINGGLPYLTIAYKDGAEPQVLYATTPIVILANIKENDPNEGYTSYIKNDDSSLILFFNYDYLSQYPVEDIQKLNLIILQSFSDLEVYAKTHKTARLNISTSAPNVIAINSDGSLRIVGEGKVLITVSSKLNSDFKAQIYIVVKYGVNDINLYSNVALTDNLNETNSEIKILKSRNQTLYLESDYVRLLPTEGIDAELKSMDDVAIRFIVRGGTGSDLENVLDALDGVDDGVSIYTIDDLFKINGLTWLYDGTDYSVDIPANTNPIITPIKAMDSSCNILNIEYFPIITQTFNVLPQTIRLDSFSGDFNLSIIKGATNIIFEKNIDIPEEEGFVQVSQLETFSFTVTLFTDYEQDEIVDNFDIENLDGKLTIVKSDISRIYEDAQKTILKSISVTYTINYKDKMTAVEEDIEYNFSFFAASNPSVNIMLPYEILGQDKINQVYGTIYANLTDFPQQPEKTNTIFNGNVGVLSVEVYPFFSNYNKMRVYYDTASTYPLLMTQLSYNITGEAGELLTDYPSSGSITENSDTMIVEKSSGQDTYLLNDLGIYSYSKIYFFSLLVSTEVPDNTEYNVYVQFLNRDNTIIETFTYSFTTIAQPSINLSFDNDLKSVDDVYYLPLNTNNNLYVDLVNYEGEITWEITSNEVTLGDNDIEVLTPTLNEDGTYNFRLLRYGDALVNDNVFSVNLIGKTLTLKGSIIDNDRVYSHSVDILVTMFTVRDINVQNSDKGYMTLPMSTTTPLQVALDVFYDEALINSEDNWYAEWYAVYEEKQDTTDMLYKYLTACGYEISKNFSSYLTQLTNAISKANYDYNVVSSTKTSGVWFYNSDDESGYIQTNKDYNSSTFGVELYNEFFAVHGYQIDKDSNLELRVKLAYTNNEGESVKNVYANGIPNVYNYNISPTNTTYKTDFEINKPFILNFVYQSSLIEAIPVSTAEEFINMEAGSDYRLINDIVLEKYTPISTAINSFDGNNYNIYITSFSYDSSTEDDCVLGLFNTVDTNTILYNVKVYYTNKVTLVNDDYVPGSAAMTISLLNSGDVQFGGIAVTNNGVLTNCRVLGKFSLVLNVDKNSGTIADTLNGGLVATNSTTGYITNCKVENFDLSCYGITGGFVGQNNGRIVASYFNESSLNNLSSDDTAGFVYNNEGEIFECFAQGKRKESDNDIRNTGAGVGSKGIVGGFVHTNTNIISDCYSNISLSSSKYISGFVYTETNTSIISRCYSISYKASSDNSTVASPFAGANSANYTEITINGQLNNCYFLNIGGTWNSLEWANKDEENKKAVGLTLDEFSTHTNFTNYDLSLTYKTGTYADNKTQYNYIDGYTWVIIEGKPVIVSTLVDTISQSDYIGKFKNYSNSYTYYNAEDYFITEVEVSVGASKIRKSYYTNPDKVEPTQLTDNQLLFYTIQDNIKQTLTYNFTKLVNKLDISPITITYSITLESGVVKEKHLISAEHTDSEGKIVVLDVKDSVGLGYQEDKNFRANDTIEITYDEDGIINNIIFKELESASYHYGSNAFEISHVVGSRTNPQMIFDYNSFVVTTSTDNIGKYYRVVKDINFNYQFTPTAYIDFQGSLQGNYMNFNNLSISYLNNASNEKQNVTNSFGLFSKISTVKAITSGTGTGNVNRVIEDDFSTTVSNLKINVVEVLSNSHRFVGGLAGQLGSYEKEINNRKIIINNVSIGGVNGKSAYIQGKNAVGGLAGLAVGNVIIKDINCSVNVNATKEINNTDVGKILYIHSLSGQEINGALDSDSGDASAYSVANLAYAGGVIGIFHAEKISDESTQKDYNANNITIGGEISVIGGIVGSAFGLIGNTTVVNFVNSTVQNSNRSYLKASGYAGGLVGENRGRISSSSITYGTAERYSNVKVGSSNLIEYNYFYNERAASSTLAIGGLVGLNNGGEILNSISTIDVRNKTSIVAGGAVGRMVEGKLEYVISSGSVVAENVVGGLIGTINNADILTHSEGTNNYDEAAISSTGTLGSGGEITTPTIISNSVAATNWQITDYTYYKNMKASNALIAGFVGLIAYSGSDYNFIAFENTGINRGYNYYSNTVYTSINSTSAQMYLKPAYKSNTLDKLVSTTLSEAAIEVLTYTDNAGNSEQAVFPYSIREMYYEDTLTTSMYQIKTERNPLFSTGSLTQFIYTLESATADIENINDLYISINLTELGLAIPQEGGGPVTGEPLLNWYNKIFGRVYIFDGDKQEFVVANKDDLNKTLYYVPKPNLDNYIVSKKYQVDGINDIVMTIDKDSLDGSKYDEYTLGNIDDFEKVQRFVVNGIEIPNIIDETKTHVDDTENKTRTYKVSNDAGLVTLPNGVKIIGIKYCVKEVSLKSIVGNTEVYNTYYRLQYIELKNLYNVAEEYIESYIETTTSQRSYTLSVDSKAVIYENFMDSGYWKVDKNFLLNANYEEATKYLINLEYASVYLWNTFIDTSKDINTGELIYNLSITGNTVEIFDAVDLATFAHAINNPDFYDEFKSKDVVLKDDIDLSGKYWVPIANNASRPFLGTFTGLGKDALGNDKIFSIKYATVNQNCNLTDSTKEVDIAALFGYVGNNAVISDLIITGGDMTGKVAAGIIGYSVGDVTITNVTNRNNITGSTSTGGIVGYAKTGMLTIVNGKNYGEISHHNSASEVDGVGGIVGYADKLTLRNCQNNGVIYVFNNKTLYTNIADPVKTEICVGGLVGKVKDGVYVEENSNKGNITINSNAHTLKVGGVIGSSLNNSKVVRDLKNYADLNVNSNNIYSALESNSEYAFMMIGGVVGDLQNNLTLCGNEGKINFSLNTTSNSYIGIGGVAGFAIADNVGTNNKKGITESYNTNNIEVSTINVKAKVSMGGILGYAKINDLDRNVKSIINVRDCYNAGDLQSDSNGTIFAGGIVGSALYEDIIEGNKTYLLSMRNYEDEEKLYIANCINLGYVNITNINESANSLGAIVGLGEIDNANISTFVVLTGSSNFYLRDSAYSGATIYPGYSVIIAGETLSEGSTYKPVGSTEEVGCQAQLMTSLKNMSTYDSSWNFALDESGVWVQSYDTWYPSIKNNISSSMWIDKQEDVSQEKGSFVVSSAEQLAYLSAKINSGEIETTNVTIKLTDYIDLSNRYWTPIGTEENPFKGTFDGNGFVIRNITIDGEILTDVKYAGLFGFVQDATIKNLGIESVIIKNVEYAATLTYSAKNSVITKVYSDYGGSSDSIISARCAAGGLICFADNCIPLDENNSQGGLYYSYNNIPVEINGPYAEGKSYVGGLIARMRNTLIDNSYNNANGSIATSQKIEEASIGNNNQVVITDYADKYSGLFNVFNLAPVVKSNYVENIDGVDQVVSSNPFDCLPMIYDLEEQDGKEEASIVAGAAPEFGNLKEKEGTNLRDIWTEEYTLNDIVNQTQYPSIRGLGQEWKNTESEALMGFTSEDLSTDSISTTLATIGVTDTLVDYTGENKTDYEIKTYYLISSAEELAWVSTNVNSGNLSTRTCEFILVRDIDLSNRYWTPIGSSSVYPFQGIFNFNGHVIKGLTIDSSSLIYGGLFGFTNGAKIINGYLVDSFVKLKYEDPKTNIYVGALVGKGYNTTIENIYVSTAVGAFSNSGAFVGGLIGSLTGTQDYRISNIRVEKSIKNKGSISAFESYIDISAYYHQVVEIIKPETGEELGKIKSKTTNIGAFSTGGNVYAGGVVGYISGYELEEVGNEYLLNASYSACNLSAVSTSNAASVYAGGVVGYALEQVSFNNIQSSGMIKTFTNQTDILGGIIGYMSDGNIKNAYFSGYLEYCQDFNNHYFTYVGGIVGYMQTEGWLKQCVNKGELYQNTEIFNEPVVIGGIVGFSNDRYFTDDENCIFSTAGFANAVAVGLDELKPQPPANQNDEAAMAIYNAKKQEYDALMASIFSTDTNKINSDYKFDETYWVEQSLKSKLTYITGCGTTYKADILDNKGNPIYENLALQANGALSVDFGKVVLSTSATLGEGNSICVAVVDENFNYIYCKYTPVDGDGFDKDSFVLNDLLQRIPGVCKENLIYFCLSIAKD